MATDTGDEGTSTMELPKQVDIFARGQLCLKVGKAPNEITLRVSREILCAASPVFSTMLSSTPTFMESTQEEIVLADDEPQAMYDYCMVVHHRGEEVLNISPERIRGLAAVAHMRGSGPAIAPWLSRLLAMYYWYQPISSVSWHNWMTSITLPRGLTTVDVVILCHMFNIQELLARAISEYVEGYTPPVLHNPETLDIIESIEKNALSDHQDQDLLDTLEARRQSIIEDLLNSMKTVLDDGIYGPLNRRSACKTAQRLYGEVVYKLYDHFSLGYDFSGPNPQPAGSQIHVDYILREADRFIDDVKDIEIKKKCRHIDCYCHMWFVPQKGSERTDISKQHLLADVAHKAAEDKETLLCLPCFRDGVREKVREGSAIYCEAHNSFEDQVDA